MEWTARMNSAIQFIEDNLETNLSIRDVAEKANSSVFHFQRMFFAVLGITPAEYIRRRRLTLAAVELSVGNGRVIDVAQRYGYESPNSFTRAFRTEHGINPREVGKPGVKLSVYDRVTFHIEIKGGQEMQYTIIEKPAFELVGRGKDFTHENFFKEASSFWKNYVGTQEYSQLWQLTNGRWGHITEAPLMSAYLPAEKNQSRFTDLLGIEKSGEMDTTGFEVVKIPAATYAEFHCTYQTSVKMNKYIYGEWFPSTGYERDATKPDIASYFPVAFLSTRGMGVRWWIPVVKGK